MCVCVCVCVCLCLNERSNELFFLRRESLYGDGGLGLWMMVRPYCGERQVVFDSDRDNFLAGHAYSHVSSIFPIGRRLGDVAFCSVCTANDRVWAVVLLCRRIWLRADPSLQRASGRFSLGLSEKATISCPLGAGVAGGIFLVEGCRMGWLCLAGAW